MNILEASLRLFNAIPEELTIENSYYLKNGILMPNLKSDEFSIEDEVSKIFVNLNSIQSSFYKTWESIEKRSQEELAEEAIKHYFSTYGAKAFGLVNFPVYMNEDKGDSIELGKIFVVGTISKEDVESKIEDLLYTNIALNKNTLLAILSLVDFYKIKVDVDKIKNKEIKTFYYYTYEMIPYDGDEIVRLLQYALTKNFVVIKSNENIRLWKESCTKEDFYIYSILYNNQIELSKVFFRYKPLLLALKENKSYKGFINKIRKLSKTYWEPKEKIFNIFENVLNNKENDFKNLNIYTLIKILNKSRLYRFREENSDFYKIRNGKLWFKIENEKANKYEKYKIDLAVLESQILKEIKSNIKNKTILLKDKNLSLAVQTSEKDFIGQIPYGSTLDLNKNKIIGIQWTNKENNNTMTDIDLSAIFEDGFKIGWNAHYKTKDNLILYSGDMTDVSPETNSASEYILSKTNKTFILVVNCYNKEKANYDLIVADDEEIKPMTIVDPNKIKYSTKLSMENSEETAGYVKDNIFTFMRLSSSNSRVSNPTYLKEFLKLIKNQNCLKIDEIFNVVYEENLTKEELLAFNEKTLENPDTYIDLREITTEKILNLLK